MIQTIFEENPTAWFIALFVIALVLALAVKYRFWLGILKVLVALLVIIILYFAITPFLYEYLFDPPLIVKWFWKITPNIWDDFYMEIDFAIFVGFGILSILLLRFAIKGKKRADKTSKTKVRVDIE